MKSSLSYRLSRVSAWIFFVFLMALTVFILTPAIERYAQIEEAKVKLEQAKFVLSDHADSEAFKTEIRILDLHYRTLVFKQYAEREWGHRFWFAALGLWFLSFALCRIFKPARPPYPGRSLKKNSLRKVRLILGGLLMACAAVPAAWLSRDFWKHAPAETALEPGAEMPPVTEAVLSRNWASFRGGANAREYPIENLKLKLLWEANIPLPGFGSPVIWEDQVILSGADRDKRGLFSFNLKDGALRWQELLEGGTFRPKVTDDTGFAAPTPVTDGDAVYGCFATGEILSVGLDGTRRWVVSRGVPPILYGYASSPLVEEGLLIVQDDTEEKQTLRAYDCRNGKEVWTAVRESAQSWSSPIVMKLDSAKAVGLLTCISAEAFDLKSGKPLWRNDCMAGEVAPSPVFHNGVFWAANDNACAVALDAATGEERWRNSDCLFPDVASPVCTDSYMILFSNSGVVTALKCSDGSVAFEYENGEGFYSSPLRFGNRILAVDLSGKLLLLEARDTLEVTDTFETGEKVITTPAVSQGRLALRAGDKLRVYGWEGEE